MLTVEKPVRVEQLALEAKVAMEGHSTSLYHPFQYVVGHETSSLKIQTAIPSMLAMSLMATCSYELLRLQSPPRQKPEQVLPTVVNRPPTSLTIAFTNFTQGEITIEQIVKMIVNKESWPEAIHKAFAGSKMAQEWDPPKNLGPCDPTLCKHPSTNAVHVLNTGKIPGEIIAAIENPTYGWTKKGAKSVKGAAGGPGGPGAAGTNGASVKGASTAGAPGTVKAGPPAGAPASKGSKPKRNARADASIYDSDLFARYAYPEAFYDNELFIRDMDDSYGNLFSRDAEPEYHDEFGLYARNADVDFDDDFSAYARDAAPKFDDYFGIYERDAEAWSDDGEISARDAAPAPEREEVAHMTDEDMQKMLHTLQTNKKAQAAVMKVVNEDPYLAHYAHELEDNYD